MEGMAYRVLEWHIGCSMLLSTFFIGRTLMLIPLVFSNGKFKQCVMTLKRSSKS